MPFSDKEKIRCVFEEDYAANVKSENLSGYGEMYTEDALWMAPDVRDRVGISDIVEGFSEQIANNRIDPIFTAEEIEVIGDFGYVVGISIATVSPKDGSPSKEVKFRALWLMKKSMITGKLIARFGIRNPSNTIVIENTEGLIQWLTGNGY